MQHIPVYVGRATVYYPSGGIPHIIPNAHGLPTAVIGDNYYAVPRRAIVMPDPDNPVQRRPITNFWRFATQPVSITNSISVVTNSDETDTNADVSTASQNICPINY